MGKDMSSVDAPFGFQPWGPVLRSSIYAVVTLPVIYVQTGDIVQHEGTAIATKFGTFPTIKDDAVVDGTAATQKNLGAVLATFDENMDPIIRLASARVGDGAVAGFVLVADHPDQLYLCQEDGTTNAIDLADVGQTVDIQSATISEGNAYTGISTQEIASDTVAADAAHDCQLHYPHPDDTVGDDTNCHCRWIVSLNTPFYDKLHVGV